MLTKVCFLVILATVVMSAPIDDSDASLTFEEHWANFKTQHNKSYESPEEEASRFEIFKENLKKIQEHNKKYEAGESTFKQGINAFADLTHEEFAKSHLGLLPSKEGPQGLVGSH